MKAICLQTHPCCAASPEHWTFWEVPCILRHGLRTSEGDVCKSLGSWITFLGSENLLLTLSQLGILPFPGCSVKARRACARCHLNSVGKISSSDGSNDTYKGHNLYNQRRINLKQDFKRTEIKQFSMSIQVFGAGPCNS